MATIATTHVFKSRLPFPNGVQNQSGADLQPNLCLMLDTSSIAGALPSAKLPGTGSNPSEGCFLGVSPAVIPNTKQGNVYDLTGDIVVCIASGTIAAGDHLTIETTSGKEGRVKTTTADGMATNALCVGHALEGASDGDRLYVRLQVSQA